MEVWYTQEREVLHREIDERRMARAKRREARMRSERRRSEALETIKTGLQVAAIAIGMYGILFWGAL